MSVELVPCHVERDMYMMLAKDYIDTLHGYDEKIIWDEQAASKWMWDARFIVDGGIMCGFIITEEVRFKNSPGLLYIAEMYVAEDERRRGVGIEAVRAAVEGWDGEVFLYILDKNEAGKSFWDAVERELGWERTTRAEVRLESGCELRVYRV